MKGLTIINGCNQKSNRQSCRKIDHSYSPADICNSTHTRPFNEKLSCY